MECLCGTELDNIYFTRKSNCLFSQLMITEYCLTFFSILGLFLNIIIQEINRGEYSATPQDLEDGHNDEIGSVDQWPGSKQNSYDSDNLY